MQLEERQFRMHASEANFMDSRLSFIAFGLTKISALANAVAGVGVSLGYTINVFLLVDVLACFFPDSRERA